ncbi:MAG: beta-lactamase [uncultured bacterium]|nr:MAG: beta-lactamase [uncultured bacterium]
MNHDPIISRLSQGINDGVFPSAELLVAQKGKVILHTCAGHLPPKHKFDLASLTKPLATATLSMLLTQQKCLHLTDPVQNFYPTNNLMDVSLKRLLNHTSGLIDCVPFFQQWDTKDPPHYKARRQHVLKKIGNDNTLKQHGHHVAYGDLGYVLMGAILEQVALAPLDQLFSRLIAQPLKLLEDVFFVPLDQPPRIEKHCFVPTEFSQHRQRIIQGEVMDDNAYALGGVCGHAGLFGNARGVHAILNELRDASLGKSKIFEEQTFKIFCAPPHNRNWTERFFTAGFDTPTKNISQSGTLFSKDTIGHLGFSGTSFWWDLTRDFWIILLTNRTMPERDNVRIKTFRPPLHDLIITSLKLV